ncbi:MAG: hypothetical protein DRP85_07425 [Candidatus Makaraimicrobium thalassicum]|nr:MAG: hypothetical protein DRP85_07425 [Candidatus Omnitrophota bacterium]
MNKLFVVGMLALFCLLAAVSVTYAYVTHGQSVELNVSDPDAADSMTEELQTIDIVRSGLINIHNRDYDDIIRGHGCGVGYCPVCYGAFAGHTAINLYSSLQIVDRGYVLKDGDTFCSGDELESKYDNTGGEWFTKGGPSDTPPIQWMSCPELKDMVTHLVEWHKTNVYPDDYKPVFDGSASDSYIVDNDAVNRDDIVVYQSNSAHYGRGWSSYLALLCCQGETSPLSEAEDNDVSVYEINSDPKCVMYFDSLYSTRGWGDWMDVPSVKYNYLPEFKPLIFGNSRNGRNDLGHYFSDLSWIERYFDAPLFQSSYSMTLTPVEPAEGERGPDIEITKSYYQSSVYEGAPLYLRLVVRNTGDMLAHIDTVSLNADVYDVIYKPESLYGGETSEIIVETKGKDISELKLTVEYFSDELGCLPTKNFIESFSLGSVDAFPLPSCRENSDCEGRMMNSPVCCRGLCYDLGRGTCDDLDGDGYFEWSYY